MWGPEPWGAPMWGFWWIFPLIGLTIAAIYAGSRQDHRVQGLVLIAPHFIVEDISVKSIAEIKRTYETTDLKAKLARWHESAAMTRLSRGAWP